jgi:enediyne biosynthesis protein E3
MTPANDVALRMENIMQIFRHANAVAGTISALQDLAMELDKTDNEFRSVAYEGASMTIVLRSLEKDGTLDGWKEFKNGIGKKHNAQVHAGLGWALAQKKIPPGQFVSSVEPFMLFRVADGYGYYDGIFRSRTSVVSKIIPSGISSGLAASYDQGIGRALYYRSKGDPQALVAEIRSFPADRQSSLWRGVGMACVFVGGCDDKILRELADAASTHRPQLGVGAALVATARADAGSVTPDTILACSNWCNCAVEEAVRATRHAEAVSSSTGLDSYKLAGLIAAELSLVSADNA